MSISDETMATYYRLLLGEELPAGHPMDAKKRLGFRIVERFHGTEAAQGALDDFNTRFSKGDLNHADLPSVSAAILQGDAVSIVVAAFEKGFGIKKSRGDARRLIEQGSAQLRGEKLGDPKATPTVAPGDVLRLDKTHAVRVGE